MILTRRRGGTEKDAEKQRRSQERRGRRQRRSGGYAARRARQGKFGENAMTKNQSCGEVSGERRQQNIWGRGPMFFLGQWTGCRLPRSGPLPRRWRFRFYRIRPPCVSRPCPRPPNEAS